MARLERIPRARKTIRVKHLAPEEHSLDYILLPCGYSYNAEVMAARKGDTLRFYDGSDYTIYAVRTVKVKGGLAELLSQVRYGISIRGCMARWRQNVKLEGHATTAISDEECLWVVYEKRKEGYGG